MASNVETLDIGYYKDYPNNDYSVEPNDYVMILRDKKLYKCKISVLMEHAKTKLRAFRYLGYVAMGQTAHSSSYGESFGYNPDIRTSNFFSNRTVKRAVDFGFYTISFDKVSHLENASFFVTPGPCMTTFTNNSHVNPCWCGSFYGWGVGMDENSTVQRTRTATYGCTRMDFCSADDMSLNDMTEVHIVGFDDTTNYW
jgi:hypothetical protein